MRLIPAVRNRLSTECFANRIRKGRCSLSLGRIPSNRLIVDLDHPAGPIGIHKRRCDYLFFAEVVGGKDWVAPIELKSGEIKASEVHGQLQSGALAVERLVPAKMTVRLVPIVAGSCHKAERKHLGRLKVTFRGSAKRIRLRPCNSPLATAFE